MLTAGLLVAVVGCKENLSPDKKVSLIEVAPRTARLYTVGQQVEFSVVLTTEAGTAGEGIPVAWVARDASLIQVSATGVAKSLKKGGSTYVVASAGGKSDSALVEVPATACGAVMPATMTIGQVITDIGADGFCAAGSGAEYTVVAHNTSLASIGSSSIEISAVAVGNPPTTYGASRSVAPAVGGGMASFRRRDIAAESRHRQNEEATMAPLAAAMRSWYASRSKRATLDLQVPAVGDLMTINVDIASANGCAAPTAASTISMRVAAVSDAAVVLADPRNPTGGFTDPEYAQFAAMFDSVIYPLDVGTFGTPTDLDANQRVLLVFTKAVNERTPAGVDYYIGGLTHSRDLAPRSSCAGSNVAEMFYLLVPDPTGTVNTNVFSKSFVTAVTDVTVAHEFQHLINFARRRYLLPGAPLPSEELWLNEGLSHIAEELLYYRRTGRTPRANVGLTEIGAQFDHFANYMSGNFLNYDEYASAPPASSPFRSGDDLMTRGATWSFLRYAVDQKFPSDGQFWLELANGGQSGQTGLTNLQNRLGVNAAGLAGMLRDFNVAVYADDYIPGTVAKYTHPSWNMRSIYPGLQGYPQFDYPLTASFLSNGQPLPASISAGGFKLYRFRTLTASDGLVRATGSSGSALPPTISLSVIRTK
ncbi:MAG: hypothetical protein ABIR92_03675 [Gemmatimonadaceae bacterium]